MKTRFILIAVSLALASVNSHISIVRAQGSLTPPPGAPAPTMKSLAQIEPRTPISALPYLVATPGSYYVTTNLTGVSGQHGITIGSGNVTIDLNGFTLTGVTGGSTASGIYVGGSLTNITIANGTVTMWPGSGVDTYSAAYPRNMVIQNIHASGNGACGILTEADCIVRDCVCLENGTIGIHSVGGEISHCICRHNGTTGISMTNGIVNNCLAEYNNNDGMDLADTEAHDCKAQYNTNATRYGASVIRCSLNNCQFQHNNSGIAMAESRLVNCEVDFNAGGGVVPPPVVSSGQNEVRDCRIYGNGGIGLSLYTISAITHNFVADNANYGLFIDAEGSQVVGNNCASNLFEAILIEGSQNLVDNNNIQTPSGVPGIHIIAAFYTNNVIIRNTVIGNGPAGFQLAGGPEVIGPIVSTSNAGVITNTSPFANFSF